MINNEILSFIKEQLAQGTAKDKVKDMLVTQGGWDEKDVEEAFETINFSGTSYPSVLRNAEALAAKNEEIEAKDKNLKNAFAPASELISAVSSNVRPTVFSPGSSRVEQPKSMEPSTPISSFPAGTAPSPRIMTDQPTGDIGGLRARIASGVSNNGVGFVAPPVLVSRPTIQPVIKEPVISPSAYPQPSVIEQSRFSAPATSPTLAAESLNGGLPPQTYSSESAGSGSSLLPSLNKTAISPVISPQKSFTPPLQTLSVFPKSAAGNFRVSPTPAQFAALREQKRGGRFLLGLMMFLIGLAIGGISMNAYMKGSLNTSAWNRLIEKGMDTIGLGTVTAPSSEAPSIPVKIPAGDPNDTGS
jgi:hypothetical protein